MEMPVSAEPECCEGPCEGRDEDPPIMMGFKPHEHSHGVRSITLIIALSFHSIIEGLALGVQSSSEAAVALFLSIVIHKCVVSFGVGVQLARTHAHKLGLVIISILVFAIMSPIGCGTGIGVEQARMHSTTKDVVIMVLEGLSHPNMAKLFATFIGFLVIALMRIMEHEHGPADPHHDEMNITATQPFNSTCCTSSP
ncbi:unnamed protein product [Soboliphyme baturini]|uniref:Zinc transporter ZIP3 n=1 Tax=Soboliphyme baturini TaxID=241478 RepID=A0A183IM01_9BILA|nr:unnamed protein product [Soboliphyme baturini]